MTSEYRESKRACRFASRKQNMFEHSEVEISGEPSASDLDAPSLKDQHIPATDPIDVMPSSEFNLSNVEGLIDSPASSPDFLSEIYARKRDLNARGQESNRPQTPPLSRKRPITHLVESQTRADLVKRACEAGKAAHNRTDSSPILAPPIFDSERLKLFDYTLQLCEMLMLQMLHRMRTSLFRLR